MRRNRLRALLRPRRAKRRLGPRAPGGGLLSALSRPGFARRGLGAIYLVAFTSLRAQALGLYGERGILPARPYLERLRDAERQRDDEKLRHASGGARQRRRSRWRRLWRAPTLLWLDASDAGLLRLGRLGQLAGGALALGLAPRLAAAAAWAAYLSFMTVGRELLGFQWDVLLLEAGLQAMLGRPRRLLTRALAFRLQLESGLAKLASHDPTWRDFSACCYHQETQPLPTTIGWYAHHLPRRAQQLGTALTLLVECVVPFLAFGPRAVRRTAFAILTAFQGLIALTGNYGFFNWLTAVLNLAVIEEPLEESLQEPAKRALPGRAARRRRLAARILRVAAHSVDGVATAVLLLLDLAELTGRVRPRARVPALLDRLGEAVAPLRVVGSYGLFSMMTTTRLEVVIEGSDDGRGWREYQFRYKPGDVRRAPRWVAPHQPRLDWQMWFAPLGYPLDWFASFLTRLLQGSPDVLALLDTNPFPAAPPRYVRALLYDYKMTDLETHRRTGAWWVRTPIGIYFPESELRAAAGR